MRTGSKIADPTPPRHHDGGGGGGWRWLVTAQGIVEAELIKGAVEAAGVTPVVLDAHDPSPGAWMFPAGNMNALVRLFVPASLLDQAKLALLELGVVTAAQPRSAAPRRAPFARVVWVLVAIVLLTAFLANHLRALLR